MKIDAMTVIPQPGFFCHGLMGFFLPKAQFINSTWRKTAWWVLLKNQDLQIGCEPEPLSFESPRLTSEPGGCISIKKIDSPLPRRKCPVENMSYNLLPIIKFNTHKKLNMHHIRRQKATLKLNVSVSSFLPRPGLQRPLCTQAFPTGQPVSLPSYLLPSLGILWGPPTEPLLY